ncbi:high-affinity potassium transport [Fusarium albosuccineum]|uniref:Potassium transport protein n=1 Tax=Fusarium albosuccineum TaxID=1237068 RepID=A0A8H4NZ52_9HYPO|nr:high-affinity potassium transport [Fusarium albosuccineum]
MLDSIRSRWEAFLENHEQFAVIVSQVQRLIPPINFITIHYIYFIFGSLFFAVIFWASSEPSRSVPFIDCLFLVVSSFCDTGLNTVDLSDLTTWQQVLLYLLFIIGSALWVSFWTVMARKHAFEKRFEDIVMAERESRKRRAELKATPAMKHFPSMKQFPTIKRMMTFDRFKSSPPTTGTLPGLGTRQRTATEAEKTDPNDLLTTTMPMRRAISAPEESISSDSEDNDSNTTTVAAHPPPSPSRGDHIAFANSLARPDDRRESASIYQRNDDNSGAVNGDARRPSTAASVNSNESEDFLLHWKKILNKHNTSKRGQFYDLSSDEREAMGGIEYRALKVMAVAVPLYGFLWQFLCALALGAYINNHRASVATDNAVNPWWCGIFLSSSAFNNAGMSLLDANMTVFQDTYFVQIVVGILVLAGNTGYPLLLRLSFWCTLQILKVSSWHDRFGVWQETIEFILKYPRRVYTTLFPSRATWWLFAVITTINTIDWLAFEVLNIGNDVVEAMPVSDRVIAGWFQAVAVRAAGFAVVSISGLYPAVQLLYMIMMYISVYPVSITMRHSNVYEERSLGIYEDDPQILEAENGNNMLPTIMEEPEKPTLRRRATAAVNKTVKKSMTFHGVGVRPPPKGPDENSRISFIGQQIRGQLAHDLWWLVVPVIVIMIIETDHFLDRPLDYSVFNVLFEVVSAYGCVGLSMGIPGANYSLSGGMHTGSKFIMCLVILRGRHRGLPVALDKAVRLPKEKLIKEEEEDFRIRRTKTMGRIASRESGVM